jgi:signal transduction histidine kinase
VIFQNVEPETRVRCDNCVTMITRQEAHRSTTRSTVLIARDRTERPIEEIAAPLRDASGRVIGTVVAFRDITDALKARAEQANASKVASLGLLAGGIARDFNTILMSVLGHVSMARATLAPGAARHALDGAEQACVRARQITWQLLTFSKGGIPVMTRIAIPRILEESATLAVRGSNVRCTFAIAPDLWPVSADASHLVQVFNNVAINAQEAMPQGGAIHIRAENIIEPATRWEYALAVSPGSYVRVSITDTGSGIPERNLCKIFDPYFTTKPHGSGLGLATSHSIVKTHGGYLSVDSTVGHGTTVHINLPASMEPQGRAEEIVDVPYTFDELDTTVRSVISCGKWQVH